MFKKEALASDENFRLGTKSTQLIPVTDLLCEVGQVTWSLLLFALCSPISEMEIPLTYLQGDSEA